MKLYLVGGFLGSGKTTAIQKACAALQRRGVKVAVITNDQGERLVDTAYMEKENIRVAQITNGCFCCRYSELAQTINNIGKEERPDIIFAESVGSCTDLIATVAKPLEVQYPELSLVISVFADASVLFALLTGNASFLNDEVRYIYKKQLEEADVLIINKVDTLSAEELAVVKQAIAEEYPARRMLFQNSLDETHIEEWLKALAHFQLKQKRVSLEVDYDMYARGEEMMAWLDEELEISSHQKDAWKVAGVLVHNIHSAIRRENLFVGHLKFLLDDGTTQQKQSFTASDKTGTLDLHTVPETDKLRVLINARVQTRPEQLSHLVSTAIKEAALQDGVQINVLNSSAFQPGYPTPVHRIAY